MVPAASAIRKKIAPEKTNGFFQWNADEIPMIRKKIRCHFFQLNEWSMRRSISRGDLAWGKGGRLKRRDLDLGLAFAKRAPGHFP